MRRRGKPRPPEATLRFLNVFLAHLRPGTTADGDGNHRPISASWLLVVPTPPGLDRVRIRTALLNAGATDVFVGGMEAIRDLFDKMIPGRIPWEAARISARIKGSSVLVFAKPCMHAYHQICEAIKGMNDNELATGTLFLGWTEIPENLIHLIPANYVCRDCVQEVLIQYTDPNEPFGGYDGQAISSFLEDVIGGVYDGAFSCHYFEMYRLISEIIANDKGIWLYKHFSVTYSSLAGCWLSSVFKHLAASGLHLNTMLKTWSSSRERVEICSQVFSLLEGISSFPVDSIAGMTKGLWVQLVLSLPVVQEMYNQEIIGAMHSQRAKDGMEMDTRNEIINSLQMLKDIGESAYEEIFQRPFLDVSIGFFKGELQNLAQGSGAGEYADEINLMLTAENERLKQYPPCKDTAIHLFSSLTEEILAKYTRWDSRHQELNMLYNLLSILPGSCLSMLSSAMVQRISLEVCSAVNGKNILIPLDIARSIVSVKEKFSDIHSRLFCADRDLGSSLADAFRDLVRSSEGVVMKRFLALYSCWGGDHEEQRNLYLFLKNNFTDGDGLWLLRSALPHKVQLALNALFQDLSTSTPVRIVEDLVQLKVMFDKLVKISFYGDAYLKSVFCRKIEDHISASRQSYLPKFFVLYIAAFLKRGVDFSKEEAGSSNVVQLHEVLRLSKRASDKFSKSYQQQYLKQFSWRFLSGKFDEVLEAALFPILGRYYEDLEEKLRWLLDDIKFSKKTMKAFRPSQECPELSVHLLTGGLWPLDTENVTVNLPLEIQSICNSLEKFVAGIHDHSTRVVWKLDTSTAVIEAEFANGCTYELNVTAYEMAILKLFESEKGLSLRQISQLTGIPDIPLWSALKALACDGEINVLIKEPKVMFLSEHDTFYFNEGFVSKSKEICIRPKILSNKAVPIEELDDVYEALLRVQRREPMDFLSVLSEVTWELRDHSTPHPLLIYMLSGETISADWRVTMLGWPFDSKLKEWQRENERWRTLKSIKANFARTQRWPSGMEERWVPELKEWEREMKALAAARTPTLTTAEAGKSTISSIPTGEKASRKFKIKKWNAFAIWDWDGNQERCKLCYEKLVGCCFRCLHYDGTRREDCTISVGACGHALHTHCLQNRNRQRYLGCPWCLTEDEFKVNHINTCCGFHVQIADKCDCGHDYSRRLNRSEILALIQKRKLEGKVYDIWD